MYCIIYKKPAEVQGVHTFSGKPTLSDILTTIAFQEEENGSMSGFNMLSARDHIVPDTLYLMYQVRKQL